MTGTNKMLGLFSLLAFNLCSNQYFFQSMKFFHFFVHFLIFILVIFKIPHQESDDISEFLH